MPAPCSSLQSHFPGAYCQCSPWARLCWTRLNRPSAPHNFKAWCGQSAAWCPTDPAHLWVSLQGLPFCLKPPKGFLSLYPGMTSEFQIRIRVSIWISCIRYLLKHIAPSFFLLSSFAGPPKDVLSCVLLLLSPGDEWHIRDSLQLILSFMLCESKLRACSPFTLYLLSFEIILNVMLNVRWELGSPF